MAFGSAEVEDLAVIPDEGCALSWVTGGATEVALLDPHLDFRSTKLLTAASLKKFIQAVKSWPWVELLRELKITEYQI